MGIRTNLRSLILFLLAGRVGEAFKLLVFHAGAAAEGIAKLGPSHLSPAGNGRVESAVVSRENLRGFVSCLADLTVVADDCRDVRALRPFPDEWVDP